MCHGGVCIYVNTEQLNNFTVLEDLNCCEQHELLWLRVNSVTCVNSVNRERKSCRAKYYKLNIDRLKEHNPKHWWNEVKRISNFSNKQDPISLTNVETFSNLNQIEQANEINKAFLGPLEEYRLQCSLPHLPLTETSIYPEVSEIRVQNVLSKLPTNRASGPDKLPNWV